MLAKDIRRALEEGRDSLPARVVSGQTARTLTLTFGPLTGDERRILLAGCLINASGHR